MPVFELGGIDYPGGDRKVLQCDTISKARQMAYFHIDGRSAICAAWCSRSKKLRIKYRKLTHGPLRAADVTMFYFGTSVGKMHTLSSVDYAAGDIDVVDQILGLGQACSLAESIIDGDISKCAAFCARRQQLIIKNRGRTQGPRTDSDVTMIYPAGNAGAIIAGNILATMGEACVSGCMTACIATVSHGFDLWSFVQHCRPTIECASLEVRRPFYHSSQICCVCLSEPPTIAFLPCRHNCVCFACESQSQRSVRCPICRADVTEVVRLRSTRL